MDRARSLAGPSEHLTQLYPLVVGLSRHRHSHHERGVDEKPSLLGKPAPCCRPQSAPCQAWVHSLPARSECLQPGRELWGSAPLCLTASGPSTRLQRTTGQEAPPGPPQDVRVALSRQTHPDRRANSLPAPSPAPSPECQRRAPLSAAPRSPTGHADTRRGSSVKSRPSTFPLPEECALKTTPSPRSTTVPVTQCFP